MAPAASSDSASTGTPTALEVLKQMKKGDAVGCLPASYSFDATDLSPYEIQTELIQSVIKHQRGEGIYIVRGLAADRTDGIDPNEDDVERNEEEEAAKLRLLSAAEVSQFRGIVITSKRHQAMTDMQKLVLEDQYGKDPTSMYFDAEYADHVCSCFSISVSSKFAFMNSTKSKLDMLLAFTVTIAEYNSWMDCHDPEWDGSEMITGLADMWRALLENHSAASLGIDTSITLPGIAALLENFNREIVHAKPYNRQKYPAFSYL